MKTINGVSIYSTPAEILAPAHTAMVVVDMQNDGCLPTGWMAQQAGRDVSHIMAMVPRLQKLLDEARKAGVFVVFIEQTTLPNNLSDPPAWLYFKTRDGRTRTDYNVDGTWGQQTMDELKPLRGEPVVRKNRPSAFHETNLDTILKARGIESVLVTGTITQGCVLATTLDASFHNYYTALASDCVQSYSQEQHANALRFLGSRYDLLRSDQIIDIWHGDAEESRLVAATDMTDV